MPEKIIIAEDHAEIIGYLERLISRRFDVEVDTVSDGKPLVERVRNGAYSVVLTDNRMLELSGPQATREIREFNQDVPIIMLSASDIEKVALKIGVTHYLHKPITGDTLYPVLDNYLTLRT